MVLYMSECCEHMLMEACAETLETLRIHVENGLAGEWLRVDVSTDSS